MRSRSRVGKGRLKKALTGNNMHAVILSIIYLDFDLLGRDNNGFDLIKAPPLPVRGCGTPCD